MKQTINRGGPHCKVGEEGRQSTDDAQKKKEWRLPWSNTITKKVGSKGGCRPAASCTAKETFPPKFARTGRKSGASTVSFTETETFRPW